VWGQADADALPINNYLLLLGLAFVCYGLLVALLIHRRSPRRTLQWLMIVALLARAVTLCGPHRYNSDVWRYLWDGHLLASGVNPYAYSPDDNRLNAVREPMIYAQLNPDYNHLHTVYGPVAMTAFAMCDIGSADRAWNVRVMMTLGDIATIMLLILLLRRLRIPESWALVYALNPLLIDSFAERGQMEGLLLPLLVLSLLLLTYRRCLMSGIVLALCLHVKIVAVVLIPLFLVGWLRVEKKRGLIRGTAGLLSCGFMVGVPLMLAGPDAIQGLVGYASHWRTNAGLFVLIESYLGTLVAQVFAIIGLLSVTFWLVFQAEMLRVNAMRSSASATTVTKPENKIDANLTLLIGSMGLVLLTVLLLAPAVFP